jgi:hypothetical protein
MQRVAVCEYETYQHTWHKFVFTVDATVLVLINTSQSCK